MSMPYGSANVPILGQPRPQQEASRSIELYDSDILVVEKILNIIKERATERSHDYDAFDREIKERFFDAGYIVDVKWYSTNVQDVYSPDIEIIGRTEKQGEFDHEKMGHEVVNDILELGTGGKISVTSDMMKQVRETEQAHKKHGDHD
jgi:hypothetical protein